MFEQSDLEAMAGAEEIRIETRAADGATHRTIIWIVERDGVLYVRSVNGAGARWYREALADPAIGIHVDGRRVAARAIPATDAASIEACSEALRVKYRSDYSLGSMLREHTLETTMRVEPA